MRKHIHKARKKLKSWEKHRNITWTIAIAFFVTLGILGYIDVTNENFDREVVGPEDNLETWNKYKNTTFNFSLRYPNGWVLESPSRDFIIFESLNDTSEQVTVSILELGDEREIRDALNIVSEKRIPIHKIDGSRIVNLLTNGNLETVVLVQVEGDLFVIRGTSSVIDDIVSTVKFLGE